MQVTPNVSLGNTRWNIRVILSHEGVKVDHNKIKVIKEWKIPKTLRHLQGYLKLTGYYRRFVKNYGKIEAPLTKLLNKGSFSWNPKETKALKHLK